MSSGIEFETDMNSYRRPTAPGSGMPGGMGGGNEGRGMTGWLMRKGIVKSPNGAQVILVGVVIANVIIMYVVITYFI